MQAFQNNLDFSLYTASSICHMVTTLGDVTKFEVSKC